MQENTWVIDHASGQDGSILATRQISSHVDRPIKDLVHSIKNAVFLRDAAGNPQRARWPLGAHLGSQSKSKIWFMLPPCGASSITIYIYILFFLFKVDVFLQKSNAKFKFVRKQLSPCQEIISPYETANQ